MRCDAMSCLESNGLLNSSGIALSAYHVVGVRGVSGGGALGGCGNSPSALTVRITVQSVLNRVVGRPLSLYEDLGTVLVHFHPSLAA